ncbi:MAG: hypothetical protein HC817_05795, partial [Saprospiraceae bacterium]|nr:hypothetical protein [Saprospiraceae bacterium]
MFRPANDNVTSRPLVIILPTSNFLPRQARQSPTGIRVASLEPTANVGDSFCIALAQRLSRMGYVTAVADYRMGWNPIDPNILTRTSGLINAAYRGVQDARTCIRFFKANAATYGIDTTRIALWGVGTGGYITSATATLDAYNEIINTKFPENKFINTSGTTATPMVTESINGDIE